MEDRMEVRSTYFSETTASGVSPETAIKSATSVVLTGISIIHDETNNPTVELFDHASTATNPVFKRVATTSEYIPMPGGGLKLSKGLVVKQTVGGGTVTVVYYYHSKTPA